MSIQRRLFLGLTFGAFGTYAFSQSPSPSSIDKKLTPEDRLAASASLYKRVSTYRDEGTLTQVINLQGRKIESETSFTTALERGGRFRWQFRHSAVPGAKPDQLYAIWSADCKSFDSYWTLNGKRENGQQLDMPLAGATGISKGAATAIIPMLDIENGVSNWGLITADLLKPEDKGEEEVEKIKCWKISGKAKFGDTKVTLWIDNEGLIRKIYYETVVDPSKLPEARAPKSPPFTTFTTILIKPVINEAKIDDSKFAREEK